MKRGHQPFWTQDEPSERVLLRQAGEDEYFVAVANCTAHELAELGKAIIDALKSRDEGRDLDDFVDRELVAEVAALQDGIAEFTRNCILWMQRCERLEKRIAEVKRYFADPWRDGWLSSLSELLERAIIVRDCWEHYQGPAIFAKEKAIDDLCKTVAELEGEGADETVDDHVAKAGLRRDL